MNFILLLSMIILNISSLNSHILISLGGCCTVAGVQRNLGLRQTAYPFDWMFSSFESIYNSIEDDFAHFLDPESLRVAEDNRIVIDYYNLQYVHDFPTIHHTAAVNENETHEFAQIANNWKDFIVPIREKYFRRIERFRNALNGNDHVFLIRCYLSKEEAIKLKLLIAKLYPKLNFTIVAITDIKENKTDWNIEKIKNFYIEYENPNFINDWKNLYFSLGINSHYVKKNYFEDTDVCNGSCRLNMK